MSYSNTYIILFLLVTCIVYLYYKREYFVGGDQDIDKLENRAVGLEGPRGDRGNKGPEGPTGPSGSVGHSALNMIMNTDCDLERNNTPCKLRDDFEITSFDSASIVVARLVDKFIDDIKADLNDTNILNVGPEEVNEYKIFVNDLISETRNNIESELDSRPTRPASIEIEPGEQLDSMEGMIVPYCGSIAPDGWQICDGSKLRDVEGNDTGAKTPDLRGRFILGGGNLPASDIPGLTDRIASDYITGLNYFEEEDGEQTVNVNGKFEHLLTEPEMPPHSHTYDKMGDTACYFLTPHDASVGGGRFYINNREEITDRQDANFGTISPELALMDLLKPAFGLGAIRNILKNDGFDLPHREQGSTRFPINITPPFIILMYIIKRPPA